MAASESLLKKDHPVVVNKNATKNSTKVGLNLWGFFCLFNIFLISKKKQACS